MSRSFHISCVKVYELAFGSVNKVVLLMITHLLLCVVLEIYEESYKQEHIRPINLESALCWLRGGLRLESTINQHLP